MGASVGVAVSLDGGTDASQLLHHADAAAYRAALGRGRAEVFDEALRAELEQRTELERSVRAGLTAGEFVLHYQPVVDLGNGRVIGHEALLRWARPGHGLVPPDAFIPTAEQSGLICDLGRWVLLEATAQLAAWRRADPERYGGSTVAVNISGRHVSSPDIVADVTAALGPSGLPPSGLVLEITETVLVDQLTAAAQLRALRALGVAISIDDFGTGYTSIGQLRHLQADTLKIDRSFIGSDDLGTQELVGLMIHAAHAFGLTVVAEGVEHAHQVEPLRSLACDQGQGFLFARPQPAAALTPASDLTVTVA